MNLELNETQLSYAANQEARQRQLDVLHKKITWTHRISAGVLILLIFLPLPWPIVLAIPIMVINVGLFFYCRHQQRIFQEYLEESFYRLIKNENGEV